MSTPRLGPLAAAAALGFACQPQAGDSTAVFTTTPPTSSTGDDAPTTGSGSTSSADTSGSGTGDGTSAASTTTTSSSTSTTATSASTFDVGTDKDLGTPLPAGCKGKIDFLFIISGSPVMDEVQAQLVAAFPKFIATIAAKFEDFDYHIMAVGAGEHWGLDNCTDDCPVLDCKDVDTCCVDKTYPCGLLNLVTECDNTKGAGTVFPAGYGASNKPCPIADGRRYMVKGQPDVEGTFACAATIGLTGGNWIGDNLVGAVSSKLNGPGGCNEGFLRDDALLMVTLVTPGGDDGSYGSAASWAKAVRQAKNGDVNAVVLLSIGNAACPEYDEPCQAALMFPYHTIESVLADDFGPAFEVASDLSFEACQQLVPG